MARRRLIVERVATQPVGLFLRPARASRAFRRFVRLGRVVSVGVGGLGVGGVFSGHRRVVGGGARVMAGVVQMMLSVAVVAMRVDALPLPFRRRPPYLVPPHRVRIHARRVVRLLRVIVVRLG